MFGIFFMEDMNPFYQNISSFPTVIFSFLLLLMLLFWLVAVLGLIEMDVLDFDMPEIDGSHTNLDTGLSNANVLAGVMLRFGLHGVPVTIILSLIALLGWFTSYYLVHFLLAIVPSGFLRLLAGIPVLAVSLFIAVTITAFIIKPIRPLFKKASQETVKYVLGQTAVVRTSRVDNSFGEATLEDGGAGLQLKVRTKGDNTFSKGDRVVLLEYDNEKNTYHVISEEEFTGK